MENNSASPMAIAALVTGILGCIPIPLCNLGCIMPLVATIVGKLELNKINGGESVEAGRTFAKVGMILGIVALSLQFLGGIAYAIFLLFFGGMAMITG